MTNARQKAALACLPALLILLGCAKPQHALTYRLTVSVSDNGRPISGWVIRSEDWAPGEIGGSNAPLQHTVHGDAIVLPIRGRLLVVTMAGWDKLTCTGPSDPQGCTRRGDWTPQAAPPDAAAGQTGAWPWIAAPGPSGAASLTTGQLPVLVTFDGAPSTGSAKVVDAARLDVVFGPGVQVQSATVQQSRDGVTRGVAVALPFLRILDPRMQDCILADPPPGARMKNPALGDCVWNSLFTE